jgi:hypothetical protein
MILLFEVFEKLLSLNSNSVRKAKSLLEQDRDPQDMFGEDNFTQLGKMLLEEVDLPVPEALKKEKNQDAFDEKNKPNWKYFLLLLKIFLKKDIKEKKKTRDYDCDEHVLNQITECKAVIFQKTTSSEYQSYCITSRRILEFFLTDMAYEKGNWNFLYFFSF